VVGVPPHIIPHIAISGDHNSLFYGTVAVRLFLEQINILSLIIFGQFVAYLCSWNISKSHNFLHLWLVKKPLTTATIVAKVETRSIVD
jgi:hypothetical protein